MAPHQPPRSIAGFTLVEVALAIGIISFAFVALLALLPAGNTAFRRAIDLAVCSQIAQRIIGEAQESSFSLLIDEAGAGVTFSGVGNRPPMELANFTFRAPTRKKPALRYFDEQGREIVLPLGTVPDATQRRSIVYEVNTRIATALSLPSATPPTGTGEMPVTMVPLAQITVQVAHNPVGLTLPLSTASASSASNPDPMRNLWVLTPKQAGVDVLTYSALIARAK